jgi:aconitate hydratase
MCAGDFMMHESIRLIDKKVVVDKNYDIRSAKGDDEKSRENSLAFGILKAHNHSGNMEKLEIEFDALTSPDNNYVSILQTVAASGIDKFPIPYVLSNCHNTLCAVGGTINEDDHVFGLDSVKKYGGIFVPPYKAVIHQYMREMMAGGNKMILGSDSHTRYGALGTLAFGEGGGEISKQLLGQPYELNMPDIIGVKLKGKPKPGIGPMDVALVIIGATFENNFNKNKVLEFFGPGIQELSLEFRMGIDVMTTESAALSSIWETDEKTETLLSVYGRRDDYVKINLTKEVCYDGLIEIDLSLVESMVALPYHPSNVCTIHELLERPEEYIRQIEEQGQSIKGSEQTAFTIQNHIENGRIKIDQALISGCSGGMFENISAAADIMDGFCVTKGMPSFGVNPASQPIMAELGSQGIMNRLMDAGVTLRPCICGPCFGVTDVPADNQLSIRHVTRNYPNREGSKPGNDQMAASFLMDARSIAATVRNGGYIMAATDLEVEYRENEFHYNIDYYKNQVFDYYDNADESVEVRMGPNIEKWPEFDFMNSHLVLQVTGCYEGSVTTDDLSPSGDAVAYRSNPIKLAEFTMCNKDAEYVDRTKYCKEQENIRLETGAVADVKVQEVLEQVAEDMNCELSKVSFGGVMVSHQIGDGSSREQAASSQRILGGMANIAQEFATKRYRSNLINWGLLPFVTKDISNLKLGDFIVVNNVEAMLDRAGDIETLKVIREGESFKLQVELESMSDKERKILKKGCLINYNIDMQ